MRNKFNKQLEQLNTELTAMGALCEEAIGTAARSFRENDPSLLPAVKEAEIEIDHKERDIETLCMKLLMEQQPVARDLRTISSAMKMISDMERIGDQAADIAEILKYVLRIDVPGAVHISDMASAAIKMVTGAVDSFVRRDLEAAKAVQAGDDVVDGLFLQVKQELTKLILHDPKEAEACLDLLMIAKYLERIGDHATNIAEWVEYSITGMHKGM